MANYFLLYAAATSETGRSLGQWLKDAGMDIEWGNDEGDSRYLGVIRWGNTKRLRRRPEKILNKGTAIQRAGEKFDFMLEMKEAGIRIPPVWTANSPELTFPCLGRKREHIGGRDIVLCMQRSDLAYAAEIVDGSPRCDFFSGYVPVYKEFRLHVFGERVIKSSEKVRTVLDAPYVPFIRNLASGYTFRHPEERVPATTRFMAVQAVELAGLDFGAVDVIVGDDGLPYVLEVNTGPGLHVDSSLEVYGRRILEEFA